ncbi:MAG TPA: nucleotidyltransferase [Solimonas sp.]|nr:nucleotidyltransferase [Solimonas sp.]
MRLLNAHGVRHLVIGGYAVGFHGHPRATGDLDIFVGISEENAGSLVKVFQEFGFDVPELKKSLFLQPGKIVRIGRPPMRLEVLNEIAGVGFDDCYKRRVTTMVDHVEINFIGLDDLLVNKAAAGRPKDLADVDSLRRR